MPVLRYFVFVGGALLALLLVCNAVFSQGPLPAAPQSVSEKSSSDLPMVRIKSERKWPERVVFDTTVSIATPVKTAQVDPTADATRQTAAISDAQKTRARDAFAQMGTALQTALSAKVAENVAAKAAGPAALKVADATPPKAAEQRSEFRQQSQPKRKVAKVHPSRPMIIVAQQPQPHFGFFDSTW
jgi:type IV secretory pathway VirB10-like protein